MDQFESRKSLNMKTRIRSFRMALMVHGVDHPPALTTLGQILIFAAAVALIILRRPDAILNPQFYAEDGVLWYAVPYNFGIFQSLFVPVVGYFQTLSQITGVVAQFIPFRNAPLLFNVVAIVFQALPVNVFLSSRFTDRFPALWIRGVFAFIYLALPNSWEVHANLTCAKWHLALLAFLVVIARPAANLGWRVFDVAVVIVSSLSGPFALFMVPVLTIGYRHVLRSWRGVLIGLLTVGAIVQGLSLIMHGGDRSPVLLGASFEWFMRIVSGQIFLGSIVGKGGYAKLLSLPGFELIEVGVFALGSVAVAWALAKGPRELRLFICFAILVLAASLISPQVTRDPELRQWQVLALPGNSGRYWLIPMIAFLGVLLWAAGQGSMSRTGTVTRGAARLALVAMVIGIFFDWRHPSFIDFRFSYWANRVEEAAVGEKVRIPINPKGWTFALIKREGLKW